MPGFNTFKVDQTASKAYELKETLLDPTVFYGKKLIPTLDQVPYHVIDFAENYGFTDLSAETISKRIDNFEKRNIFFTKDYIIEKNGYSSLDKAEF